MDTIDLTQYCPIYEDLLKTAFETGKFPNTSYTNTKAQIVGFDNTVTSRSPYVISTPGDIDGLNPDYLVFVQGDNIAGAGANSEFTSSQTSSWGNKTVLVHPGRVYSGDMAVEPSIFTTWIQQTSSISSTSASYYFPIVDIDMINNGHNDDHGIVRVIRPQISIPLHTPTCIFWGKTIYKGHNFIVPVAVVQWVSNGTSVKARTLIDWKSYLLTLSY